MKYEFEPIGYLESCFKEKFGVPRQSSMVSQATGVIKLRNDPHMRIAVRLLDKFSHIWLVFVFHKHGSKNWKPSIRPPRLGGARKVGVLASRSPHRPNPIGLSAVRLKRIDLDASGGIEIHVSGVDLLDGTPILDLKPYVPYADVIPDASSGWADAPLIRTPVEFSPHADSQLAEMMRSGAAREGGFENLRELLVEILELDPRPAFQRKRMPVGSPEAEGTEYGFRLFKFDVKWVIRGERFVVTNFVDLPQDN